MAAAAVPIYRVAFRAPSVPCKSYRRRASLLCDLTCIFIDVDGEILKMHLEFGIIDKTDPQKEMYI